MHHTPRSAQRAVGGLLSALASIALAAPGCVRPLNHPCTKVVECAVGWSCVSGTCAPDGTDGGPPESDARDADAADGSHSDAHRPDGRCPASAATLCHDREPCQVGVCDPPTGRCTYSNVANGTKCDDQQVCTHDDRCAAGFCQGIPEGTVVSGDILTLTCPAQATAVDGIVTTTCTFPSSYSPNEVYTGPVYFVTHLDRSFADYDINTLGDGRFQLTCMYANADGLGIGGIYAFLAASSCTATADSFVCTK
jgi:hypothetical protein